MAQVQAFHSFLAITMLQWKHLRGRELQKGSGTWQSQKGEGRERILNRPHAQNRTQLRA